MVMNAVLACSFGGANCPLLQVSSVALPLVPLSPSIISFERSEVKLQASGTPPQ